MNKRKSSSSLSELLIVPRAITPLVNGEAARQGAALQACNVREREQSLQVTGKPIAIGNITRGDRLLLVTGDHRVTCSGLDVKIDGRRVTIVATAIVGAHAVGGLVVIVTQGGLTCLSQHEGAWIELDAADAVPQLTVGTHVTTARADIDAYAFDRPYSQWRAPLADVDTSALEATLRAAWNALSADAGAEGLHTAPMLVRWAVRLHDGSYLWMSDPLRVGDTTLANGDRIAATVLDSSNGFTGTAPTSLPMLRYSLNITVAQGIAQQWLPLVAAIDVFATDEARLLTASRSLDYRCITRTTAPREYVLEMGLSRRSAAAIASQLASSPWHLVATAPVTGQAVAGNDFATPLEPLTMTNAQCAAIGAMRRLDGVVASACAGGRLYCCTRAGDVVVSEPGNALAQAHHRRVQGAQPLAMAVVTRPLYSGGFGRYPVYVFTDDGIYAIPQTVAGTLGEARLVDRTVIAAGVPPVEARDAIYLVSRHSHLCRLSGARLDVCLSDVSCTALAWSDAYGELWMLRREGNPLVLLPSGSLSERTLDAAHLYSDPRHALAVTAGGELLDLEREAAASMPVVWLTHPVAVHRLMAATVGRVLWHLTSDAAALTLTLKGQRGIMSHELDVSTITVAGAIDQPLATAPMALRMRTLRLQLTGTASSGTLLLPTLLFLNHASRQGVKYSR